MTIYGHITSNGEPSAYSSAYLSDSKGNSLNHGTTSNEDGYYKLDTSKVSKATHVTFASGGTKKSVALNTVSCGYKDCGLDINLKGKTLPEITVTTKNEKSKDNTLRNVILISVPLLLVVGIVIYYKTKKK